MKKNIRTVNIIIALIFIICIATVTEMTLMFRAAKQQMTESGTNRLEAISGELDNTISDAKINAMKIAVQAQSHLGSREELEDFIIAKKAELISETNGVCFNTYVAGTGWSIIPGFDAPGDYVPTKRSWYTGAVKNGGSAFVSDPYVDAASGNICYSVSVMLSDKDTVLALDYTMEKIQQHIGSLCSDGSCNAVIVTEEGIIAGYPDESYIGKMLVSSIPDYAGIYSLARNSDIAVNATVRHSSLFATRSEFGWYLIVCVPNGELFHSSYIQMLSMSIVTLLIFALIMLLYIFSARSAKRAENAMNYSETMLKKIVSEIQDPLQRIITGSSEENVRHSADYEQDFKSIREAGSLLSEKIDMIISYSSIVRSEKTRKSANEQNDRKKVIKINKRFRTIILAALMTIMSMTVFINTYSAFQRGKGNMMKEVSEYNYRLTEWINTQKSILDMFCSIISTEPDILNDYDRTVEMLDSITQQYPDISVSYFANSDFEHSVYMNNGWIPDKNLQPENREWYKDAVSSPDGWNITSPYFDAQTGFYCITFSEVVTDAKTGEFLGVFGIDFYMDKLVDILGNSYSENGYAFLTDAQGNIINHPFGSYQMTGNSITNIVKLPYSSCPTDAKKILFIRDYDDSLKVLIAHKNQNTNFTVYVVSSIWNSFGSAVIYGAMTFLLLFLGIFTVYRLITALMRMQEEANVKFKESADAAIAADEAKSTFLAHMSHEIRTPINAVLGMNDMILRESSDPAILEYSTNIRSAGRTLLSLINSILDFSKIEDGKMEIIPVEYDTTSLIHDLAAAVSPRASAKGLTLNVIADPELPSTMLGDDVRLRQIISNLLTNAVKYTEKGTVTLTVKKDVRTDNNIILYVEVRDTGIGIREEDLSKLFESFRRLDEKRNRNIEGTGLGMTIVTKLLDMMNSKLYVSSVYGEGSVFSFKITQGVVNPEPMGDYIKRLMQRNFGDRSYCCLYAPEACILIVDDNEMNLKVAANLLKIHGIKTYTALSGEKALDLMRQKHYDIVLLDHMMPKMDGIETLAKIKEEGLDKDTNIIALTANAVVGAKEMYLKAGFSDYITKPIEARTLEKHIAHLLPENKVKFKEITPANATEKKETPPEEDSFSGNELKELHKLCPNIDFLTGLGYCMDSKEFYLDTLQTYADTSKLKVLETAFAGKDWENYRINVHSLKSTSLTIGALLLSEHAKTLEFAVKENNPDYIIKHHNDLIKEYTEMLNCIGKVLNYEKDNDR